MLTEGKLSKRNKNRVYGLTAMYHSKMREKGKAVEFWDKCMDDVSDKLNRIVCRLDKARYKRSIFEITEKEYMKELEIVAQLWRGDQLEVDILEELGDIYNQMGDYTNALRSWRQIKDYYPNTTNALLISGKMGDLFTRFFLDDLGKEGSPVKALALFYEFQDLLPIGEVGDRIIVKFAYYLADLDLLDRSAALLSHQVKRRLEGRPKEEAINKLAEVHLKNNKPHFALDAIAMGDGYQQLSHDIAKKRKYIHAKLCFLTVKKRRHLDYLKMIFHKLLMI